MIDNTILTIMQGDQYRIPLEISIDGAPIDDQSVDDIEIVIGSVCKSMVKGDVTYSASDKVFLFPITQAETFRFTPSVYDMQARIKPKGSSDVVGVQIGSVSVIKSNSKAVL